MPHSCAVKTCRNKAKTGAPLSFHRLPVREPERLKLWLCALNIDVNSPLQELKKYIVCSEHFVPADYTVHGQTRNDSMHRFLTSTAVPRVGVSACTLRPQLEADMVKMTSAERTRRYRERLNADPARREELLRKRQEKYKEKKLKGEIKPFKVKSLPPSQRERLRELWRIAQLKYRTKKRNLQVDSENDRIKDVSLHSHSFEDTQPVSEELLPSLQQHDIKVEQIPSLEETEIHKHPKVKQEQVDQCISPDVEADTSNDAEVRHPKTEPTTNCELLPPSTALTVRVNESIDDAWDESDGSSSPHPSHSVEVFVDLEQPPREEKSCRFCGKSFKRDSYLIRHVDKSHKGHKAFKCLECNKEFEQRYQLILHIRIHTGEKPFSCDYCDKTFVQNSSRLAHMRVHTGEKPYFCAKCGKSFATSNHFKFCKVQNECKITPEKGNVDENHKDEKAFKCFECNKEFNQKHQLVLHARVHTGEKPFSCDFCGKSFTQNSNRIVHMRQHTGEKPYFCKKCGKRFASSHHLKLCTGTQNKSTNKSFRCTACGRTFHTDSDLKVHMEVHESWKRHISKKLQGQEMEEKKHKAI